MGRIRRRKILKSGLRRIGKIHEKSHRKCLNEQRRKEFTDAIGACQSGALMAAVEGRAPRHDAPDWLLLIISYISDRCIGEENCS